MSEVNDMPTDQELFQQALIALEIECKGYNDKVVRNQSLIAALRERLAQPERQPPTDEQIDVLTNYLEFARAIQALSDLPMEYHAKIQRRSIDGLKEAIAKLAPEHSPQRQPLTDARIDELWCEYPSNEFGFARAIEAAHGIGNL